MIEIEKVNILLGENSVKIEYKDGRQEFEITGDPEQVDDKSIHVITSGGIFLINFQQVQFDGEDIKSMDELLLKIPEKKQTNPN